MILRVLVLACVVIVSPCLGKMTMDKFSKSFEHCFQNDESDKFQVNGQDTPLSNTMQNFISMAEKFEMANPLVDTKDELLYFISEYLFENIQFTNGIVDVWSVGRAKFDAINTLWDPDTLAYKPEYPDIFTEAEKCSIYHMISHSILQKDAELVYKSYGNDSFKRPLKSDIHPEGYFPQEVGVVAIPGTDSAVSLGKVLLGLYVGLNPSRTTDVKEYIERDIIPQDLLPHDTPLDVLYAVTMSEILMLSSWSVSTRRGMAKNGKWVSIPLNGNDIDGFCPMVYKQEIIDNILPAYSYSSVRGAADGLILGLAVSQIHDKKHDTKLSQILRMYYSPEGISVDGNIEDINAKRISVCNRQYLLLPLEKKIQDQMGLYGSVISDLPLKDFETSYNSAKSQYTKESGDIFKNSYTEIGYCDLPVSIEKPEILPIENFLDVIVVMDSSHSEKNFIEQQLITGYLAKTLDMRYTGCRMTVLLDHKINSVSGTSSKIDLKPVVSDTHSSSCAACTVGQIAYEPSVVPREDVIVAINQYLQERKDNETAYNGVNGKVVVLFNYENGDGKPNNNKMQGNVERALRDFYLRHQDVILYAVGMDSELLKKYARNDPSLFITSTSDKPDVVAANIFKRLSKVPALLQYSDCKEARSERTATYENFISPNKVQHYKMSPEYFYKSYKVKVTFESQNGLISVCYSRATMKPENEMKFCKNTTANTGVEFQVSNPCKSFTKESCSPFYFAVMGIDSNGGNGGNGANADRDNRQREYCKDINDHWCSNLNQVKFRVSHDGIRCSGCLGLGAPPALILLTVLFTYFLYKKF